MEFEICRAWQCIFFFLFFFLFLPSSSQYQGLHSKRICEEGWWSCCLLCTQHGVWNLQSLAMYLHILLPSSSQCQGLLSVRVCAEGWCSCCLLCTQYGAWNLQSLAMYLLLLLACLLWVMYIHYIISLCTLIVVANSLLAKSQNKQIKLSWKLHIAYFCNFFGIMFFLIQLHQLVFLSIDTWLKPYLVTKLQHKKRVIIYVPNIHNNNTNSFVGLGYQDKDIVFGLLKLVQCRCCCGGGGGGGCVQS